MKKVIILLSVLITINLYADSSKNEKSKDANNVKIVSTYAALNELYAKSCDTGEMDGCYELGILYQDGKGVEQNNTKANELWTKACTAGHAESCLSLGNSYRYGRGVDYDVDRANRLWTKACDEGSGDACFNYIELMETNYTIWDLEYFEFYHKACYSGVPEACRIAGQYYTYFPITKEQDERGSDMREKIRKREAEVKKLYVKACNDGSAKGCTKAFEIIKHRNDEKLKYAVLACEGGRRDICNDAGSSYYAPKKDMTWRLEFSKKACALGSCKQYTRLLQMKKGRK